MVEARFFSETSTLYLPKIPIRTTTHASYTLFLTIREVIKVLFVNLEYKYNLLTTEYENTYLSVEFSFALSVIVTISTMNGVIV